MAGLDDSAQQLLSGKNVTYSSSINPDGSPHVTPTWIDTDGQYDLVNTHLDAVKKRNIKRDPRVAIAVTDQINPYKAVIIRGRVVQEITGSIAQEQLDKLEIHGTRQLSGKKNRLDNSDPQDRTRTRNLRNQLSLSPRFSLSTLGSFASAPSKPHFSMLIAPSPVPISIEFPVWS